MAKNNYLSRFFLCLIAGLCVGIGGVVVESFQQSAISFQSRSEVDSDEDLGNGQIGQGEGITEKFGNGRIGVKSGCDSIPSVILSGTQWSRKISPLDAERVRLAKSPISAINQQIYSLVSVPKVFMSGSQFSIRYAPVEMTAVRGLAFEATSLETADLVRNQVKQIYTAEIGVREKTGKNDGERVEEYLAVTQLGKGYAWCAAFVSWVFSEADFPEPRTPWSPALFPKKRVIWERGNGVLKPDYLYNNNGKVKDNLILSNTHNLIPNTRNLMPRKPATADVFGIYFANLKRIAHVGFVDEWGEKQVITVEGNTNEAGSAEGDGVYRKRRPIASIYQVANWIDLEVDP